MRFVPIFTPHSVACLLAMVALGFQLGACGHDSANWPTLAPRLAERRPVTPDPVLPNREEPIMSVAQPSTAADPAASAALASLRPRLAAAQAALARATRMAPRAPLATDAWAVAQTDLSRAEQTSGDLDDLLPRFGSNAGASLAPAEARSTREALSRQIEAAKRALAR